MNKCLARASVNGESVTVYRNRACEVPIPRGYYTEGTQLTLYCKGTSALSGAYVCGIWDTEGTNLYD